MNNLTLLSALEPAQVIEYASMTPWAAQAEGTRRLMNALRTLDELQQQVTETMDEIADARLIIEAAVAAQNDSRNSAAETAELMLDAA
jgi:hypothetical protein